LVFYAGETWWNAGCWKTVSLDSLVWGWSTSITDFTHLTVVIPINQSFHCFNLERAPNMRDKMFSCHWQSHTMTWTQWLGVAQQGLK
jgi:hypothetical protein